MNIVLTVLFLLAAVAAAGFIGVKVYGKRNQGENATWIVPFALFNKLLEEAERLMIADGFGRQDYVLNVKDCTEFSAEWEKKLSNLLKPHRPSGKTEWMKRYSFERDKRPDGSLPGRHRVVAVKTTAGMKYIDTYRIDGSLYRELSDNEKKNGRYI